MILKVVSVKERIDRLGKQYKYLSLHSPEYLISKNGKKILCRSKRCGYIAYPVDYTTLQTGDPGADLEEGDEVPGFLITKKVEPYITNSGIQTKCTIPIFGEFLDDIEADIATQKAFKRAGRVLLPGELSYLDEDEKDEVDIPERCLIVEIV